MTRKFLTMAQGATADLDALKRDAARKRMDLIPNASPARIGIDYGGPEGDSTAVWLRQGTEFICELQPGDSWTLHPQEGVIVCSPESKPVWHHVVNGERVREILEPAQWTNVVVPAQSEAITVQLAAPVESVTVGMVYERK